MANQATTFNVSSKFYTSRDGLKLHARNYEPLIGSHALPVICLPGLSRNARDFDLLAKTLAGDVKNPRRVIAFDYRGRGLSDYDKNWQNYSVLTEAEDVVAGLTALGIEHGIFVGTSRGGLITFVLSAMRPGAIKATVLNDIGPVIEGNGLMQIRSYLQRAPKPKSWADAIETQKALMSKSFPSFTDAEWKFEAESRYSSKDGRIQADYDPKLANTMKALDSRARLPTAWPQFMGLTGVPMLLIRGENSSILSAETAQKMKQVHPNLDLLTVANQGHAPMLHTAGIAEKIVAFASTIDGRKS